MPHCYCTDCGTELGSYRYTQHEITGKEVIFCGFLCAANYVSKHCQKLGIK